MMKEYLGLKLNFGEVVDLGGANSVGMERPSVINELVILFMQLCSDHWREPDVSAIEPIEKFRQEVKEWLEANCPPEMRTPTPEGGIVWVGSKLQFDSAAQKLWYERMRDKHWFAPGWPDRKSVV